MRQMIAWFAGNSVAANLLMWIIIGGGLLTLPSIRQEVFPEFSLDMITIAVPYPGAAPEEVEEAICIRIEEEIQGVDGLKRVRSTSIEGLGTVVVELTTGAEADRVLDDVKARVDAIDTFPEEAEEPVIQEILNRRQVIYVAVSGDADETTIKELGAQVRDEIAALPGITQVELTVVRPYEISIEVSEAALRRHGTTFDEVARAVRGSSLDLPGGSIKTAGGEILLRTKGQAYRGRQFEDLVLLTRPDGTRLRLGEVARVVDGFAETDQSARFDGQPTALVQVFRVGDQKALDVARKVKAYIREAQPRMPEGITLTRWGDYSVILKSRMDLLMRNGRAGFALVVLVLALFLRFRLAFWVSLGIPISFLGALWLMPSLGVSINMISLFAFIVVLGIVVDDAIIVGENVYTHRERGQSWQRAAIEGTQEVMVPVTFAVLTTVAAFAPLLGVEGTMGKIMRVIPAIVITTLLFSFVESKLILPAHLAHVRGGRRPGGSAAPSPAAPGQRPAGLRRRLTPVRLIARAWERIRGGVSTSLSRFVERGYRPALERGLEWRYLMVAAAVTTLLLTVGLVAGGWIRFTFFPDVESDYIAAYLTMPQGTPAEVTSDAVRRIEESAAALAAEIDGPGEHGSDIIRHVVAAVGGQPYRTSQSQGPGASTATFVGAHLGEVTIELAPSELRRAASTELARRWRELTGPIPDAVELVFTAALFDPGEAFNIQLAGPDLGQLRAAAEEIKAALAAYPGVVDVTDSFRAGKREVKLRIKPAAEALGLTMADLARQVRQAFYGEEAQRIQRGRDEVKVMVRYPAAERRSLGDLETMRIRTASGGEVPFAAVAEAEFGRGYDAIRRTDRRRAVNVTADVDPTRGNANEILADLTGNVLPGILADHPGVTFSLEGEQREQRETLADLARGFALALLMIYALMAVPFRSYIQPLIVMAAIPFGLVGAVWGHILMRMDLTILSMFGVVALAGVVVNDSLVLVDFINRRRAAGESLAIAVREAGVARFRAILLTSLTTFVGLLPLLLEKSVQAQFLIPMAISLGFGVMFATFISLLLVPAGYVIVEDLKALPGRLLGRRVRGDAGVATSA